MTTGRIAPDRFTHGTSAQRVEWFRRGLTAGTPDVCNTFARDTH
jgi:predicted metalloprotease